MLHSTVHYYLITTSSTERATGICRANEHRKSSGPWWNNFDIGRDA
jgi:hypothetical protein